MIFLFLKKFHKLLEEEARVGDSNCSHREDEGNEEGGKVDSLSYLLHFHLCFPKFRLFSKGGDVFFFSILCIYPWSEMNLCLSFDCRFWQTSWHISSISFLFLLFHRNQLLPSVSSFSASRGHGQFCPHTLNTNWRLYTRDIYIWSLGWALLDKHCMPHQYVLLLQAGWQLDSSLWFCSW